MLAVIIAVGIIQRAYSKSFEYDSNYGKTWIVYTDEEGIPHYVNLSDTIAPEDKNILLCQTKIYLDLYTRKNKETPERHVVPSDGSFHSKVFLPKRSLKILAHGWFGSCSSDWVIQTKNKYLMSDNCNVIVLGWQRIAKNPIYPIAAYRTRYAGAQIAAFLDRLVRTYSYDTSRHLHLIGYSLGAHVLSFAAKSFNGSIYWITGLDPARPMFEFPFLKGPKDRLDKSDAKYVEILHTSAGQFGLKNSYGHADFYPNGGSSPQPGCSTAGLFYFIEKCSHNRAVQYFMESIKNRLENHDGFVSYPCSSWQKFQDGECKERPVVLGDPKSFKAFGNYYFKTNSAPRFARGELISTKSITTRFQPRLCEFAN